MGSRGSRGCACRAAIIGYAGARIEVFGGEAFNEARVFGGVWRQ